MGPCLQLDVLGRKPGGQVDKSPLITGSQILLFDV